MKFHQLAVTAFVISSGFLAANPASAGHPASQFHSVGNRIVVGPTHHHGGRNYSGYHSNAVDGRYGYPGAFAGYGYVYNPYGRGRFEAPDLLNDPYFQAEHKFDSHFPGRYRADRTRIERKRTFRPLGLFRSR